MQDLTNIIKYSKNANTILLNDLRVDVQYLLAFLVCNYTKILNYTLSDTMLEIHTL